MMARRAVDKPPASMSAALPPCPDGFKSWAEWVALAPPEITEPWLDSLPEQLAQQLQYYWPFYARPAQLAPPGDWQFWVLLSGRGSGKTRSGAEWVIDLAQSGRPNKKGIALVGATVGDALKVIIHGESGILARSPPWFRPVWNLSARTLTWPNGEWACTYSADRPDRFRGVQHAFGWADEVGAWRYSDAWNQFMFGMRLGKNPQVCVTTTPRPTPLIRKLIEQAKASNSFVRETTYANRGNLAASYFEAIIKQFEGSRLGRQELEAEILDDNPGALWSRSRIDAQREALGPLPMVDKDGKPLSREALCERLGITKIVVAVDPAVTSDPESSDETGIIVVGTASREKGYVLDDLSGHYTPNQMAAKVLGAYDSWKADAIVAEVNNGGDLVEHTLRTFSSGTSMRRAFKYEKVHASRGKRTRAEPVAALDEQFRIHHVGSFGKLEDQLTNWDPVVSKDSPDRLDAYVWGVTYLMVGKPPPARGNLSNEEALAFA